MRTPHKTSWMLLAGFASCAGLATAPAFAVEPHAADVQSVSVQPPENAQSNYLIKLLEASSQFRVRAQAAISLGMLEKSQAIHGALTAALHDVHPAVRAAAATSLGRIGDVNHLNVLRELNADPEQPVRNAARTSIAKLENTIEEPPARHDTATMTAALSPANNAERL